LNWTATEPTGVKTAEIKAELESSVNGLIIAMHPVCAHMVQFGLDYHKFMDDNDPVGLLGFIEKYRGDSYWRLAKFANGLQMDLDAVKNALLYPDITNGPTEGINSLTKCVKRASCGRAKIDLLVSKTILRQRDTEKKAAV